MYYLFRGKLEDFNLISIKSIINEVGFVILKNKDFDINLSELIANFGVPIPLDVFKLENQSNTLSLKPYISSNPKLSGFNFSDIPPHTDTGFLDIPAEYVFIKSISPDIMGNEFGLNGIVDVYRMVERMSGSKLLKQLNQVKFPFLKKSKNQIKFKPIIELNSDGTLKLVRFHIDRILSAYKFLGKAPKNKESKLLNEFLSISRLYEQKFFLQKRDVLIVDNHLMLHSRTNCNIEQIDDFTFNTRHVEVAFVRKHG
jgi:hypothetical protein